jgi:hypothetical protein
MSSNYSLYSDNMMQTTWLGLKLEDITSPLIVFRAASTVNNVKVNSYVLFDMLVNVGQGLTECNNGTQFSAPRTGVYFLAWSSASVINTMHEVLLHINGESRGRASLRSGQFPGTETAGSSAIIKLNAGDVAQLFLYIGSAYSDSNYQLFFSGFLYEPIHGQNIAPLSEAVRQQNTATNVYCLLIDPGRHHNTACCTRGPCL